MTSRLRIGLLLVLVGSVISGLSLLPPREPVHEGKRSMPGCKIWFKQLWFVCLLIVFVSGCACKAPGYKQSMIDEGRIFVAQSVLDTYRDRALNLFSCPDGMDIIGYFRSLKLDTNRPVTFGFTDEGRHLIVRVPALFTNGTPVLVETQYDYSSWTGELFRISFTVEKKR